MATVAPRPNLVPNDPLHVKTDKRLGWVRDLPDSRDVMFAAAPETLAALPPRVDLRSKCPPVYDQGQLGSCTANAIAAALQFDELAANPKTPVPSRLFIYYNERAIEGTIGSDSGAQIRDGVKSVAKLGAPPEADCPYVIGDFTHKPSPAAYADALKTRAIAYMRVAQTLSQMKGCLAAGFPFVFGFTVYERFMSPAMAASGVGSLPKPGEKVEGGHAVMAVGYDDASQTFIIRNSWADTWGMKGYFTFPYPYLTEADLSDDFWTIRRVS
ncbi:MAG TPA: C1 family peptidase [Candidatus Eremiobacteraceae bacterium]|nr:C1 family peptidase [Candidatus Eremiobacteraceae bacterium]